jgi:isocitrate dehydrogenase (NAD+)
MVDEGRDKYADPSSMLRAGQMLLAHIGYSEEAGRLQKALDICTQTEKRIKITGRSDGATNEEFSDYVMGNL